MSAHCCILLIAKYQGEHKAAKEFLQKVSADEGLFRRYCWKKGEIEPEFYLSFIESFALLAYYPKHASENRSQPFNSIFFNRLLFKNPPFAS